MTLAERLPQIWYRALTPPLWLRALVPLYRGLRVLHRMPYALGLREPRRLRVPVVVVGNLTVGGTGKTPLVIALVAALRERGYRPGVISRGYGANAMAPALLNDASDPARCGDEPVLIRTVTGVPVAIGRDRVAAAQLLLAAHDCDVLIADDGLQHYPLFRNVEICVIDGERRFGNGFLLPAGPLREPLSRLDSVTFRVCNSGATQPGEVPMQLVGDEVVAVLDATAFIESRRRPLSDFAGQRVHAIAGIGNPSRFFAALRAARIIVVEHPFPDHHRFVATDFAFGDDLPVLMTQKDAVKCATFADESFWQVPVSARLPDTFFDAVVARIVESRMGN